MGTPLDRSSWQAADINLFDDTQFEQWRSLLEERIGLQVPKRRRVFLKTCLAMRMRELGMDQYQAYFDYLTQSDDRLLEWQCLAERLTVQETRFFRDPDALQWVKQHSLTLYRQGVSNLNVWSLG